MNSRRMASIALLVAGPGLHLSLASGHLLGLPVWARLVLSLWAVVFFPGFAFVAGGLAPAGGRLVAPGWALGFGVAWNTLLLLVARALGVSFHTLVGWGAVLNLIPWLFVPLARGSLGAASAKPDRPPASLGSPAPEPARISGMATAAVLAAVLCGALFVGRTGPSMTYTSDAPDHIGTLRRMIASGDMFPHDAFFRDAPAETGADPRKGLWHPQLAVITMLAGADPVETWRVLPAPLVAIFILNMASLGYLVCGSAGAAVAAWAFLLCYGGSLEGDSIRNVVVGSRVAEQLATAALVAVLSGLVWPGRRWRIAAALLGFAAVAAHVFAAIHIAVALGALALGFLLRDRRLSAPLRRVVGTGALVGLACLPLFLWYASRAHAPANVIHTEPQGLLMLGGRWAVVSLDVLWQSMGWAWVLFPLAWWWLWREGRRSPAVLYLLTSSVAVALILFNPLAVAVLRPRLGYLLLRMVTLLPLAGLIAWIVPRLARELLRRPSRKLALAAAVVAVALWPALHSAARVLPRPSRAMAFEARHGAMDWKDGLDWMSRTLPPGQVVLSDPATSYSVPMLTPHYVMTMLDQHSSPNDPIALRRILDARDALDPFAPWDTVRAIVDRYRVTTIVLNNRFQEPTRLMYWGPDPDWYRSERKRLDANPSAFERLFDTRDLVVYRLNRAALAHFLPPPPPRPFARPWRANRAQPDRPMGGHLPALRAARLRPSAIKPGGSLEGVAEWRAPERLPAGSYTVVVRLDRELPGALRPPGFLSKPTRKILEAWTGEKYRLRDDHLPACGVYGVDEWKPWEVVRDSFEVAIPANAAPGDYEARILMMHQPAYPIVRLRDYFFDDDLYSGLVIGRIRVLGPGSGDARIGAAQAARDGAQGKR